MASTFPAGSTRIPPDGTGCLSMTLLFTEQLDGFVLDRLFNLSNGSQLLQFLGSTFDVLVATHYRLEDLEVDALLPTLIEKSGQAKERFRVAIRGLLSKVPLLCSYAKYSPMLLHVSQPENRLHSGPRLYARMGTLPCGSGSGAAMFLMICFYFSHSWFRYRFTRQPDPRIVVRVSRASWSYPAASRWMDLPVYSARRVSRSSPSEGHDDVLIEMTPQECAG